MMLSANLIADGKQYITQYKPIQTWEPNHGDFIIWHGWLTHWFGFIIGFSEGSIVIVKSGLPITLMDMTPDEINNQSNQIKVPIGKILRSANGEYAVSSNGIWYV